MIIVAFLIFASAHKLIFKFAQYGKSGLWLSELLPHMSTMADEMCVIKSMNTQAINHDPTVTLVDAAGFYC